MTRLGPARVVTAETVPDYFAGGGSVADIKEAGRLNATRGVLSGTKRLVDGKLRTAVRLMNAATGELLFTRSYDLDQASSLGIDALRGMASTMHSILDESDLSKLTVAARDPGMRNEKSRDLIQAGRDLYFRYTIADLDRAIGCFEKAIAMEPDSSLAHAYLAAALGGRSHYASAPGFLERAESEVQEALRLDPDSPDAYRTLAGVLTRKGRINEALSTYLRAIELGGPEERVAKVVARSYSSLGRPDRAVMWINIARHWENRRGESDSDLGDYLTQLGADDDAEAAYKLAADLHPELPKGWLGLCHLRLLQGDANGARQIYDQHSREFSEFREAKQMFAQIAFFGRQFEQAERSYAELWQIDSDGGAQFYGDVSYASAIGRLRSAKGESNGARALLESCLVKERQAAVSTPNNPSILYRIAAIESSLGETDAAILHLREAIEYGYLDFRSTALDPRFDSIRSDLQFREMLEVTKNKVTELSKLIQNQKENRYAK